MSDINLLPEELRAAERQEQAGSRGAPQPPPRYTKAARPAPQPSSQLEERLQSLVPEFGSSWWARVKEWFMKPPAPRQIISQAVPPPVTPRSLASATPTARPAPPSPKRASPPPAPKPVTQENIQPEVQSLPAELSDVPLGVVLDVNLLPADSRPVRVEEGYAARLAVVLVVSCLVVGLGYGLLKAVTLQRERKVEELQQAASQLAQAVDAFRPTLTALQSTSRKVEAIQKLVFGRHDWNKLFERLESLTLVSVSYSNASFTAEGDVVLGVEATSVADLARQLRVFESTPGTFSKVSLGSIVLGQGADQTAPLVQSIFQLKLAPTWARAPLSSAGTP